MSITTIDCRYLDLPRVAAAYLLREGGRAAFIETNTARALPILLGALEAAGMGPEHVDLIVVTHAHLDHAGGASALLAVCPNATLLCHPRAAPHLIDPSKLVKSAKAVYGEARFLALYGEVAPAPSVRVQSVADGDVVTFGKRRLTFLHTRGHANHHMCVRDSGGAAGPNIFTGDSFGVIYPALQRPGRAPLAVPSTSPTDFDAEAALAALGRITRSGAARAYPTHFGPYTDLAGIAEVLREQLEESADLVEEAYAEGLEGAELEAFCAEGVSAMFERLLLETGLSEDAEARALLELDRELNAQGLAFAVKKRRFKEQQGKQGKPPGRPPGTEASKEEEEGEEREP